MDVVEEDATDRKEYFSKRSLDQRSHCRGFGKFDNLRLIKQITTALDAPCLRKLAMILQVPAP